MKSLLDRAIQAMRNKPIQDSEVQEAARRVLAKLNTECNKVVPMPAIADRITGCADFQSLIPAYLSKSLTASRALLFEDHTRECVVCRNALHDARNPRHVRQLQQRPGGLRSWQRKAGLAAVAAALLLMLGYAQFNTVMDFLTPVDVHAIAQTVDGNLFTVAGTGVRAVTPGQRIERDQVVRTAKDSSAILQLADGSRIEMRARSELSLDRRSDGVDIQLERGSVIVTAAKQRSGHLYVSTGDCTVSVVGTIFSVNAGTKGSRVSVIEGEVRVEHGSSAKSLLPGEQLSTTPVLGTVPVEQDIAWSRESEMYMALLGELMAVKMEIGQQFTETALRHSSNLLTVVPDTTAIFTSLPNVAESFAEAYDLFKQRIVENPALGPWWQQHTGGDGGRVSLDDIVRRVRQVGAHLGSEIVIAVPDLGANSAEAPVFIAEVTQPAGLPAALAGVDAHGLTLEIDSGLFVASTSAAQVSRVLALRRQGLPSAFTSTRLYERVVNAYREGVGWLLAADLERIAQRGTPETAYLGISDVQQLMIEQKSGAGEVSYRAVLGFNQPRRGAMAWLSEPSPMGSVEFVSPNPYGVAAVVTKDASQIVEDLFGFINMNQPNALAEMGRFQQEHRLDIRHDLAAPLGGEFLFAIDGPVLPSPAWKVVLEVYDSARLQNVIEWIASEINREATKTQQPGLAVTSETVGGQSFYTISSSATRYQIHYTFWGGYLIAAPNRTLLIEAIQYKQTGNSLARSYSFRSQLPADGRDYVSGFFYQNVDVAGFQPTLICLYGETDRIVLSSKGSLVSNFANLGSIGQLVAQVHR